MQKQTHLPVYGIGPFYGIVSGVVTIAFCLGEYFHLFPQAIFPIASAFLKIISAAFLLGAAVLWGNALFVQKIAHRITQNELVTTGAYSWVRNPIYSAIMLVMWGILAWQGNLYLLLIFPFYPLFMTLLLKATEEKWLSKQYGQKYFDYCKKVNRCIPWIPRK